MEAGIRGRQNHMGRIPNKAQVREAAVNWLRTLDWTVIPGVFIIIVVIADFLLFMGMIGDLSAGFP